MSIILQNMAQLRALFEKQHESITGNCDAFLYLGGNEQSTHKYVSELLGKETLDTNTYGKSIGQQGNYTTNYQMTGRELLTPDEVRMLDKVKCTFAKYPPCLTCNAGNPCKDLCVGAFEGDVEKYRILIASVEALTEQARRYNRETAVRENEELLTMYRSIYDTIIAGNVIYSRISRLAMQA